MKEKCTCGPSNIGWMILASIVLGIGLWLLVGGLKMQWGGDSSEWLTVLLWYAGGILVMCIGKVFKWKSMSGCTAHCMK